VSGPRRPAAPEESNASSSSTSWQWKQVKVRRPPEGHSGSQPKAGFWRRFPARNAREPLKITVKFRGGPECWYEVHARGSIGRYPGYICIHDIMSDINNTSC
jgi:hypothetical protein